MSELSNSAAEPAYISRLALQSAPFNASIDPRIYYNGGQAENRLNLLLHLLRASDKIGVLVAAEGMGKSTLLTQLQQRAGDELRHCLIQGQPQLDSATALVQCLRGLGVDDNEISSSIDLAATFKNRLRQLQKLNVRPVLLIDDAHKLSAELLAELSIWLDWKDDNGAFLLQAVLASTHLPSIALSRLQAIDLPALTEQELTAYLLHRLTTVGFKGESPFSVKEITHFYRQSSGNPALANHLAHQYLLGQKLKRTRPTSFKSGLRWTGLAALIISLTLLLVFQDKVNQLLTPKAHNADLEIVEQHEMDLQDQKLTTVIVGEDQVKNNELAQRDELAALLSEIDISVTEETEKATQQEIEDAIESYAPVVEIAKSVVPDVHQQDWVLQQQNIHYTFQLMGSWDKQEVYDFIKKYELTGDVAMFESMRNGRIWYALVYGVFDNKQVALQTSSQWPAPLNSLPSWLRRFDSVQKQIKNMVQAQQ
ncbi:MAG: AAA family ATPase [Gammaproteobacteria bacterium]|nr:AAA family ATPase [Gammaproteobacteria bacterium]